MIKFAGREESPRRPQAQATVATLARIHIQIFPFSMSLSRSLSTTIIPLC